MTQAISNNRNLITDPAPKHEQVVQAIWGMIRSGDWPPGSRLPSEQDLARQFKVAHTTIRKAKAGLAKQGAIVSVNRRGTYVTEDALAYRVAVLWRGGVLTNNFGYGYRIALDRLESRQSTGMRFQHIAASPEALTNSVVAEGLVERVVSMQSSAVVLTADMQELEDRLVARSIPIVVLSYAEHPSVPCVHMDTAAMCRMGLSHFEQSGCDRVAMIGPEEGAPAYARVHRERGWPMPWLATMPWSKLPTRKDAESFGYQSFKRVWAKAGERPVGLLVLDDIMLNGVLLAMAEEGVRSGRDLQLASHYNRDSDTFIAQSFTRLEIDPDKYADGIESLLTTQLAGQKPEQMTIEVQPELIHAPGPSTQRYA